MILILVHPQTQEELLDKYLYSQIPENIEIERQNLWYPPQVNKKKKTPPKLTEAREWAEEHIDFNKYSHILICDSNYFKALYKVQCKPEKEIGYIREAYNTKLLYCPSVSSIFYNPDLTKERIQLCINSLVQDLNGKYHELGENILYNVQYPSSIEGIKTSLLELEQVKCISCDIETNSLKHWTAGIVSIAFATDEHSGVAFKVGENQEIKNLLREFFSRRHSYGYSTIWHNACFDCYVLIYELFMNRQFCNWEGLLRGLDVFLDNFEDTKIISYLATNNASGNHLSLKEQAFEFAGNWGLNERITDLSKVSDDELLEYNLTDACATQYVLKKNAPIMVHDNQKDIYENIFKPACKDIVQMQLTGMPIDYDRVLEVENQLNSERQICESTILSNKYVKETEELFKQRLADRKNKKLKTKQVTKDDIQFTFSIGSVDQLASLLYEVLELPVLDTTETNKPATGQDSIEKLMNTLEPEDNKRDLLQAIIDWQQVSKILNTFIKAFKEAPNDGTGQHWLCGKFNLGGTVSGRLSSSDPNMQNLPATGSKYAKIIKSCFKPPKGYLMIGMDFASLEDRISALTTKDPEKLKVYTDGYDGHCLRAYAYFKDQMPDIDGNSVMSINSIKDKYKKLRQKSKGCTFALTYQGVAATLVKKFGFEPNEAKRIYEAFHKLYHVSDEWVNAHIDFAAKHGYVEGAFGLRVRCHKLHQVTLGNKATPIEAEAERRTVANFLGQSWGLLNTRAGIAFNRLVRDSVFRTNILPICQIHDAQYFIIEDDPEVLLWVNKFLIQEAKWQEHPVITHEKVHLGGELSVFIPDWGHEMSIPNNCTKEQLEEIADEYFGELEL